MSNQTDPPDNVQPDVVAVADDADTGSPDAGRRRSLRGRLSTIAILAVVSVAIVGAAYLSDQPAQATTPVAGGTVTAVNLTGAVTGDGPTVGKAAPEFTTVTAAGTPFDLADLRGKAVWLTFGASWCQPCRAENPDVQAAYERFKDQGLTVVQVYLAEDQKTVTDYATRVGLTYVKIPDPLDRLANQYRILGIPSHFFIGRDGVLRVLRIGSMTPDVIEANVATILK
jgi:cytochrome c biogenesis protein CcmG, thiol:disulfide interchange protein DsbE